MVVRSKPRRRRTAIEYFIMHNKGMFLRVDVPYSGTYTYECFRREWAALQPAEQRGFYAMANADRLRYETDRLEWEGGPASYPLPRSRKPAPPRRPKKRKRASAKALRQTQYSLWFKENYNRVKGANATVNQQGMFSIMAEEWKLVPMRVRELYKARTRAIRDASARDGGSPRKRKKVRACHKRKKRTKSGYILFCLSVRPRIAEKYPMASSRDILVHVADAWRDAPAKVKSIFLAKAKRLRENALRCAK